MPRAWREAGFSAFRVPIGEGVAAVAWVDVGESGSVVIRGIVFKHLARSRVSNIALVAGCVGGLPREQLCRRFRSSN